MKIQKVVGYRFFILIKEIHFSFFFMKFVCFIFHITNIFIKQIKELKKGKIISIIEINIIFALYCIGEYVYARVFNQ